MNERKQRLEAIFHAAMDLDSPVERERYLAEACAGDPELRREVDDLLKSAEVADDVFQAGQDACRGDNPVPAAVLTEMPGDKIGRYKLLEKIGEGGMGVVYMAEQEEPVRRRVALKIIKLGMDTKQVIARFEAERQALAMMDHPNIAKVLDAGTTDQGRPYFVMELVRGIRITDYCDQHHLPTEARLELFITVCQAVQHAHQKGIIHRDIKPSNILVTLHDGVPVPKVIDFGIAKAIEQKLTDKTLFTELNQFMGTPAYMSPEQAEMSGLDIDTRSDIYSLGVLLYELLTGQTPFEIRELVKEGLDAIRRTIREVEPPRPSTRLSTLAHADLDTVAKARGTGSLQLRSQLRGDLDWIVMKALEKDRTRRYETANGFALDLRRHLADEPVTAGAPSAGYKFRKFARRNKVAFAVTATIAAVLVIATGISVWQAVRATRAEALAKQRLTESEAITKFLTGVFQSPDPSRDGRTITVAETLDKAVTNLDRDLANQPARRAQLQATLGVTYYLLGLVREAVPLQEKVLDYDRAASGPEHPNTLGARQNLADSYFAAGRRDDALKLREEVLTIRRKLLGPEHPDTLSAMIALANSYFNADRQDEALKLQEEMLTLSRKVNGLEHPSTLNAMNNLAIYYANLGRPNDALELLEQTLTLSRKVRGPEHPKTLDAMNNLANSYLNAGRRDETLKLYEAGLTLSRKVNGPEHPDTLSAMNNLAYSYYEFGRRDEALKLREQALKLCRKVLDSEHPATLNAMCNLATSYDYAGRRDEAIKLIEEVLTVRRKRLGPEHPDTLLAMQYLAISYEAAGRRDEALKLLEEVLTVQRKRLGPEHPATLAATIGLADSYRKAGRADEAIKLGQSSLELFRRVSGATNANTLNAMTELAISYQVAKRTGEAIALEEESLRLKRQHLPPEHPLTVESMDNLATCYEQSNRKPEAEALRRELAELKAKAENQKPGNGQATTAPTKP